MQSDSRNLTRTYSNLFAFSTCMLGCALGFYYGFVNLRTIICAITISLTGLGIHSLCNYSFDYSRAYKKHLKEKMAGVINPIMIGEIPVTQLRKRMALVTLGSAISGAIAVYIALGSNIQVLSWFLFLCVLCVLLTLFYNVSAIYLYRGIGAIAIFLFFGIASIIGSQFLIVCASNATIDIYPDTWLISFSSGAGALMVLYGRSLRFVSTEEQIKKSSSLTLMFNYKITSIYLIALLFANFFFSSTACIYSHRPIEALLLVIGLGPMAYQVYSIIFHMKRSVLLKLRFRSLMFFCSVNNFVWVAILIIDYWIYY